MPLKLNFGSVTGSSYTGYIDIEAKHIFFYFFESRNDTAKDDIIFWTNGGELRSLLHAGRYMRTLYRI